MLINPQIRAHLKLYRWGASRGVCRGGTDPCVSWKHQKQRLCLQKAQFTHSGWKDKLRGLSWKKKKMLFPGTKGACHTEETPWALTLQTSSGIPILSPYVWLDQLLPWDSLEEGQGEGGRWWWAGGTWPSTRWPGSSCTQLTTPTAMRLRDPRVRAVGPGPSFATSQLCGSGWADQSLCACFLVCKVRIAPWSSI